jgi:hypothetical protein
MDKTHWAMLMGAVTLVCWIGAGFAAILEAHHGMRSGELKGLPQQISLGLTVAGTLSVVAMSVTLAWP